MTTERLFQIAKTYRWELLTLLLALVLGNLWRIHDWPVLAGIDPWFDPTSALNHQRWLLVYLNIPAMVILGAGTAILLRRGQTMLAGLWALLFIPRLTGLITGTISAFSPKFISSLADFLLPTQPPVAYWRIFAADLVFAIPFSALAALIIWRAGRFGPWHALLIAAGYVAWVATPLVIPWRAGGGMYALAAPSDWLVAVLWLAMLVTLAVAFHDFRSWNRERQRLVITGLMLTPLVATSIRLLPWTLHTAQYQGWAAVFGFGPTSPWTQVPSIAINAAVLLGLTWLLATRWPVNGGGTSIPTVDSQEAV